MRKLHTAESLIHIAHLRNVLLAEGIPCQIRNDRLLGALGEIPFVDCWPELWIERDGDLLRAKGILEAELAPPPRRPSWVCPVCREKLEGQFSDCWRCASEGAPTG